MAPVGISAVAVTLEHLRAVMGADTAGFYLHERGGSSLAVDLSPDDVWRRVPFVEAPTALAARLHPGIRHLLRPGTLHPFSISDTVLGLFADGLTSTGAAYRLGAAPRTIDKHAERIYRKLGVHDRATAVMAANRLGLRSAATG
jgi:DNA-binding CsgD family transcriptional regulator